MDATPKSPTLNPVMEDLQSMEYIKSLTYSHKPLFEYFKLSVTNTRSMRIVHSPLLTLQCTDSCFHHTVDFKYKLLPTQIFLLRLNSSMQSNSAYNSFQQDPSVGRPGRHEIEPLQYRQHQYGRDH